MNTMEPILLFFSIKYKGNWDKIFKALKEKEHVALTDVKNIEAKFETLKENGYNFMSILDSGYPNGLKQAYKPPFVIYYKGDLKLLDKNVNTMISSSDKVTKEETLKQAKALANKNTLVIPKNDFLIRNGVKGKDKIIISKSGIEDDSIKDHELLISEAPYDFKEVNIDTNRLLSAFSSKLVLVSSEEQTHSKLVNSFLNMGKDVEAFMREASSQDWNNNLIKQGATPITSIEVIKPKTSLNELKEQAKDKQSNKVKKDFTQKMN